MKSPQFLANFIVFFLLGLFGSCGHDNHESLFDSSKLKKASQEEIDQVIADFILAGDGEVIEIPAGFFALKTQLILDNKKDITIRGAGMKETVLSFRDLRTGGEGVKLVGENVRIENLTIEDAPGDGIKAQHSNGITFQNINVTWTNGDKSKNGTYAIYPVQCKNVVIDGCVASHSRDAGIYVGQSEGIIVRNNLAFGNVAGIEIENSDDAEVYDNIARNNTGGILVFNLPGLPKADGKRTKIYRNNVLDNNHKNFALEEAQANGNPVSMIPPGSGIILMAAKEVDVYENQIHGNKTIGIAISSYQITGFPAEAPNWSPYSQKISLKNNNYKRPMAIPDITKEFGQLVSIYNAHGKGKSQDIIYDGFFDKKRGTAIIQNPMEVCINEPQMKDLHFTLFNLEKGPSGIEAFKDILPFICDNDKLSYSFGL
jgi:parallel beta-helix repeat protein